MLKHAVLGIFMIVSIMLTCVQAAELDGKTEIVKPATPAIVENPNTKPAATVIGLSEAVMANAERKYGPSARQRLNALTELVSSPANQKKSDMDKLKLVNDIFNRVPNVEDINHWKVEDYWATPIETMASNGGDSEDFAIGKYFTLLALGVEMDKLRILYTTTSGGVPIMVLAYYAKPNSIPLILDRLVPEIRERDDLVPRYGLNSSNLWIFKNGQFSLVGSPRRITRWAELSDRMDKER